MTTVLPFYERTVTAVDVDEDRGTADVLVCPYGVEAPIVEVQPGRGRVAYTEVIRPGAAERAIRGGAGRIPFTYGHSDAFGDRMGTAVRLWDTAEGLRASVRFDRSKLDAVQDAVTSSHRGISMAFVSIVPRPFSERDGTLVERRSIRILHIAAVPFAAYDDARVLAVRNLADELDEGPETAAEVEARQADEAVKRMLAEADELVQAGRRWDALRSRDA